MKTYSTFQAMELGFGISRLYKIYITDSALCGAKLGIRDFDQGFADGGSPYRLADLTNGQFNLTGEVKKAVEKLKEADALEPGSPRFLEIDKVNFSFGPSQITGARLQFERSNFAATSNRYGTFEFIGPDGKRRRFFVLGEDRREELTQALQQLLPQVELSNLPNQDSRNKFVQAVPLLTATLAAIMMFVVARNQANPWVVAAFVFFSAVYMYWKMDSLVNREKRKDNSTVVKPEK